MSGPDASRVDFDVLIVGAGISGVSAAYHLQKDTKKTYVIFEARDEIGGTWSIYRYPGIRSDTDMYTLGFPFNPWPYPQSLGQGNEIRDYIEDTARRFGIDKNIQFGHRANSATWSSSQKRWTVNFTRKDNSSTINVTARHVMLCLGVFDYDKVLDPELPGIETFQGQRTMPQFWPEKFDCKDKRIALVGSGATAVSMFPSLVRQAARVTMIQRSPSYLHIIPTYQRWEIFLRRWLPGFLVNTYIRLTHIIQYIVFFIWCRAMPQASRAYLRRRIQQRLPKHVPLDPHFNPKYNPWEQRMCMTPDGDFFQALHTGRGDIVTGAIDTVQPNGVLMQDGTTVEADVIVQATGFVWTPMGTKFPILIDGKQVTPSSLFMYRGIMLQDVPNLYFTGGYLHTSYTVGATLCCQWTTRLLNELESRGLEVATPRAGEDVKQKVFTKPFMTSGWIMRGMQRMPKIGDKYPWHGLQEPFGDWWALNRKPLTLDMDLE